MIKRIAGFTVVGFILCYQISGHADSFKCGRSFVEVGDSKAAVLSQCGQPFFAEIISADDERKIEQWTYKGKGYRSFFRILTFRGGVLRDISVGQRAD